MLLREIVARIADDLGPVAGELAGREAEEILERTLSVVRSDIYGVTGCVISTPEKSTIDEIVSRRKTGVPLAYAVGRKYFHSVDLQITPDALIPRPDTETLVEIVLKNESDCVHFFCDVCTGPGTIAAALCTNRPQWSCIASDLSIPAIRLARKNIPLQESCLAADLFMAFRPFSVFDFITANPPYISAAEMENLGREVRDFEPHIALFGGPDGLAFFRRLSSETPPYLKQGGRLYVEIGFDQELMVCDIFKQNGWRNLSCFHDLSGHPRVIMADRPHG